MIQILVIILVAVQVAALAANWRGMFKWGWRIGIVIPAALLGVALVNMQPISWGDVLVLEKVFLAVQALSVIVSLMFLHQDGRPLWLFWIIWLVNSASAAFMVYLAFFFRLF